MQPNRRTSLELTLPGVQPGTSTNLPDIADAVPWRTWDAAREEARRRKLPILAFAEPRWANSAQRVALRVQQDVELRDLVTNRVVPVLVNRDERPDLVATWRSVAIAQTGTAGPPLIMFLTHEGLPILSYSTMNVEADDTFPSLASLISSLAESYESNAADIVAESRELSADNATSSNENHLTPGWGPLRERLDFRRGGIQETPKHTHPMLLWSLLDIQAAGDLPQDLAAWLRTTLDAMIRGGIWDQIDRGFHRCTRDELWAVPHFEKPIPLNAQLASVYARAAAQLEVDTYGEIASQLISFCTAALREDVDVISSDTGYYTWTSKEILDTLDPTLVQVVTLHHDLKPVHHRQALRRVVEMEDMTRFSHESLDVLRTRLARGRAELRMARLRRPAPRAITVSALSWRAETVRWLLKAGTWSDGVDVTATAAILERLVGDRLDTATGYARGTNYTSAPAYWLEDQAALLAAFVEANKAGCGERWAMMARQLADILLASWWTNSGWSDYLGTTVPSRANIDDLLPSTLGTLAEGFGELGALTGEPRFVECAVATTEMRRSLARGSDHWFADLPH